MFRIALTLLMLCCSGCNNIGADAWNLGKASCPDDDYNNGGIIELYPGYCKIGRGGMISYTRNF